jgi:hypothetical protein
MTRTRFPLAVEHWQGVLRMMRERGLGFFLAFRQTDPGLDAEEPGATTP